MQLDFNKNFILQSLIFIYFYKKNLKMIKYLAQDFFKVIFFLKNL